MLDGDRRSGQDQDSLRGPAIRSVCPPFRSKCNCSFAVLPSFAFSPSFFLAFVLAGAAPDRRIDNCAATTARIQLLEGVLCFARSPAARNWYSPHARHDPRFARQLRTGRSASATTAAWPIPVLSRHRTNACKNGPLTTRYTREI